MRRYKLDGVVAWFLEAGAPLTAIGAQALYLTQPFFGGRNTTAIAEMLEEENETRRFVQFLRGEDAA